MNKIEVAENKTLKLTNVLSRAVQPEELASLPVILTQMQNFMKSNGAQPIGPLVQAVKAGTGPDHVPGKVLNGCRHNYLVSINTSITPSSSS